MKKAITYEAPELMVFEIHTAGTLCQSYGDDGLRDIQGDDVTDESNAWN